jgi:AraC-like DNA-binding protein
MRMASKSKTWQQWTQEQVDYLTENYGKLPLEEVAAHLGRSPSAVTTKFRRHSSGEPYTYRPWTKEDDEYLDKHYDYDKLAELAERFGKTEHAVWLRAIRIKGEGHGMKKR